MKKTNNIFSYSIQIDWKNQSTLWWNECCALVLEVFGHPGHRFIYRPYEDYMVFDFKTEKDANLCRILLSERL